MTLLLLPLQILRAQRTALEAQLQQINRQIQLHEQQQADQLAREKQEHTHCHFATRNRPE